MASKSSFVTMTLSTLILLFVCILSVSVVVTSETPVHRYPYNDYERLLSELFPELVPPEPITTDNELVPYSFNVLQSTTTPVLNDGNIPIVAPTNCTGFMDCNYSWLGWGRCIPIPGGVPGYPTGHGQCSCLMGYWGPKCRTPPTFSNITLLNVHNYLIPTLYYSPGEYFQTNAYYVGAWTGRISVEWYNEFSLIPVPVFSDYAASITYADHAGAWLPIPMSAQPGSGFFRIRLLNHVDGFYVDTQRIRVRTVGWLVMVDDYYQWTRCYPYEKMGQYIHPVDDNVWCGSAFRFQAAACYDSNGIYAWGVMQPESYCFAKGKRPPVYVPCQLRSCPHWAWWVPRIAPGVDNVCNIACRPDEADPAYPIMAAQALRNTWIACYDLITGLPNWGYGYYNLTLTSIQRQFCPLNNTPERLVSWYRTPATDVWGYIRCNWEEECDGTWHWEVWDHEPCLSKVGFCPSDAPVLVPGLACVQRVNPRVENWLESSIDVTCGWDINWMVPCEYFDQCPLPVDASLHPNLHETPAFPITPTNPYPNWPPLPAKPPHLYFAQTYLQDLPHWVPADKYPYYDPATYPAY